MAKKDKADEKPGGKSGKPKKEKKQIMIVAKQNKLGIKLARRLEKLLKDKAEVHFDRSSALRMRKTGHSIRKFTGDLVITVGGDGTFLWTAHKANVPILPVRIEGYGFLCTTDFNELTENIPTLIKGDYKVIERMRLKCHKIPATKLEKYIGKIRHKEYPQAVNEIAFARKRPSKILNVSFKIDDTQFDCVGDGIMFSTPAGSTAYHSSAGGAIIDPKLAVIGIAPMYPFFSKAKPMVIPWDKKIEVEIRGGDCALVIDGHGGDYLKNGTKLIVEKGRPVKVIIFKEKNFYDKVRHELMA
jgi:NAD+ kinase